MSFNAADFLASGDFNSSVTALVQAKTYNWSVTLAMPIAICRQSGKPEVRHPLCNVC